MLVIEGTSLGCFDFSLPTDAPLGCVNNDDCAAAIGSVCANNRCVPVGVLDLEAPQIVGEARVTRPLVGAGGTAEILLSINEELIAEPEVSAASGTDRLEFAVLRDDSIKAEGAANGWRATVSLTSDVEDGIYRFFVRAEDAVENVARITLGAELVVDQTPPSAVDAVAVVPRVQGGSPIDLRVVFAGDDLLDAPRLTLVDEAGATTPIPDVTVAGLLALATVTPTGSGHFSLIVDDAVDRAGNRAARRRFEDVVFIDDAPPILSAIIPTAPRSRVSGFDIIEVPVTIDDGVVTMSVGEHVVPCPPGVGGTALCRYQVTERDPEGVVGVLIEARDDVGNRSSVQAAVTFDFTPPDVESVSLQFPVEGGVQRTRLRPQGPPAVLGVLAAEDAAVVITADGDAPVELRASSQTPRRASVNVFGLQTDNEHDVVLAADLVDVAGNAQRVPGVATLTVDGVVAPPDISRIIIAQEPDGSAALEPSTDAVEPFATVDVIQAAGLVTLRAAADGALPGSVVIVGNDDLLIRQTDGAGNVSVPATITRFRMHVVDFANNNGSVTRFVEDGVTSRVEVSALAQKTALPPLGVTGSAVGARFLDGSRFVVTSPAEGRTRFFTSASLGLALDVPSPSVVQIVPHVGLGGDVGLVGLVDDQVFSLGEDGTWTPLGIGCVDRVASTTFRARGLIADPSASDAVVLQCEEFGPESQATSLVWIEPHTETHTSLPPLRPPSSARTFSFAGNGDLVADGIRVGRNDSVTVDPMIVSGHRNIFVGGAFVDGLFFPQRGSPELLVDGGFAAPPFEDGRGDFALIPIGERAFLRIAGTFDTCFDTNDCGNVATSTIPVSDVERFEYAEEGSAVLVQPLRRNLEAKPTSSWRGRILAVGGRAVASTTARPASGVRTDAGHLVLQVAGTSLVDAPLGGVSVFERTLDEPIPVPLGFDVATLRLDAGPTAPGSRSTFDIDALELRVLIEH